MGLCTPIVQDHDGSVHLRCKRSWWFCVRSLDKVVMGFGVQTTSSNVKCDLCMLRSLQCGGTWTVVRSIVQLVHILTDILNLVNTRTTCRVCSLQYGGHRQRRRRPTCNLEQNNDHAEGGADGGADTHQCTKAHAGQLSCGWFLSCYACAMPWLGIGPVMHAQVHVALPSYHVPRRASVHNLRLW